MLFFSKISKDANLKNPPQQPTMLRQALRFAFNPEIGASLRPMQETTAVFVQLLAMLFINQNMFPANHPAYLGIGTQRLTLGLLLSTVWRNLKFSRATMPQVLFFFVAVGGIAFSALLLLGLVASLLGTLLIGKAHAQGYFEAPGGDGDIAQQWLGFMFNGGTDSIWSSWVGLFVNDPLAAAGGVQGALISALAFYSDAILIVAAVILFYHLVAMTVETAHHGVVMGKRANQVWAPIRLVVAIGLLVPISGGLNSGQYIVIRITQWGSGMASNVWAIFLDSLSNSTGVASIPKYAREVVYNTLLSEACQTVYDAGSNATEQQAPGAGNQTQNSNNSVGGQSVTAKAHQKVDVTNAERCGHYAFNQSGTGTSLTQLAVLANAQFCFSNMQQEVQPYAQQLANYHVPDDQNGSSSQVPPQYDGQFEHLVADYMTCLASGLPIPQLSGIFAQSATWGWLSAGASLSSVAQAEADANNTSALIPETQAPDFSGEGGDTNMQHAAQVVDKVIKYISMVPQGFSGSGVGSLGSDSCAAQRGQLLDQMSGITQKGNSKDHFLDRVFEWIDWLAAYNCVWNTAPTGSASSFVLGIQFTGANPIAEMAHLGHAMINTAYDAFDRYVNLAADKTAANSFAQKLYATRPKGSVANEEFEGGQGELAAISGILLMVTTFFFTTGILLAYYLPLIPFLQFLFSSLTWLIAVFEAVIAIPLIALAHLNPEGDGLPGQSAKQAYYFLFNIFLRPVLMVFGLIIGLLILYAALSYINLFYAFAIETSGGLGEGHLVLSRLVYSGIYVVMVYICVNSAFKCITWLPDHALKWMGSSPMHFHGMGDPDQVSRAVQSGTGTISQATGAIQQGGWGAAQALQQGGFSGQQGQANPQGQGTGNQLPNPSSPDTDGPKRQAHPVSSVVPPPPEGAGQQPRFDPPVDPLKQ